MDLLSALKIKDAFLKLHAYILKILGQKIVKLDDYKDEEVEVDNSYAVTSPKCIAEENKGAKFYWSKKLYPGYEKYFEIDGNTRRYFTWKGQFLWIKRSL